MYMSAVNPPTYTTGTYNPSFFATTTSGITLAQGTALFLQKTTPDTASALETFNGGIITGSIDGNSTSNTLVLYPSMGLTQNMGIGNAGTAYVSGVPTIQIGGTTGYSVHCGSIDCNGTTINNAVIPATGALSLGSSQTTGVLNIGTGVRATGGNGGAINIGTNASNTAPINIGGNTLATSSNILTLNSTSTGQVSIGGTGGSVLVTPTMSLSANLTLPVSLATIPTAGTQLGGITSGSVITTGYSIATTVGTLTIPAIGTYIVSFAFTQTYTVLPTVHYIALAGTAAGLPASAFAFGVYGTGATVTVCNGTFVFRCTTVGTILLNATVTGAVTATNNTNFTATRIA